MTLTVNNFGTVHLYLQCNITDGVHLFSFVLLKIHITYFSPNWF